MKSGVPLFSDYGKQKTQPTLFRLEELEKQIKQGVQGFLNTAKALKEIKEDRLYLQVADSWEQYCKERLGRSIEAVRLHLKALEIADELTDKIPDDLPEKSHNVGQPPLPLKGLRKKSRIPAKKSQPEKPKEITLDRISDEDIAAELLVEIDRRIRAKQKNLKLLRALDEWLDKSGF